MTDWNKEPRDAVEAAALTGDPEAQTALRIHQTLDRITATVDGLRHDAEKSSAQLTQKINDLRVEVNKRLRGV